MIGHSAVRRALEGDLPPVTLLLGPASIGKRTLIEHLAVVHEVQPADRLVLPEPLTIDAVRRAVDYVGVAPFGLFKLVTGRLDRASTPALNAALKVLEEPPATARFLLTATRDTLPTVMSRCRVFRMGLLTPAELELVLIGQGVSVPIAQRAAARNLGTVAATAATITGGDEETRRVVQCIVQAIATRDRDLFERAFREWDDAAGRLFLRWLHEAITGVLSTFSTEELHGLHRQPSLLRRMLLAVSATPHAKSRLGLRAALEPFLTRS